MSRWTVHGLVQQDDSNRSLTLMLVSRAACVVTLRFDCIHHLNHDTCFVYTRCKHKHTMYPVVFSLSRRPTTSYSSSISMLLSLLKATRDYLVLQREQMIETQALSEVEFEWTQR